MNLRGEGVIRWKFKTLKTFEKSLGNEKKMVLRNNRAKYANLRAKTLKT